MTVQSLRIACLTALLLAAAPTVAADSMQATVEEIRSCVTKNAPAKTMRQRSKLESVDRSGDTRTLDVKSDWKLYEGGLSKVIMRIQAPPDLRGSAFLMIEREGRSEDLFSYLPELDKVRRITMRAAGGSLFGSDFSYEDMVRLQNLAGAANTVVLADDEVEGRSAWVIEATPTPGEASEYARVVGYIDKERCVPLKAEFYDAGGTVHKLLTVPPDRVVREGEGWVPMEVAMENKQNGTRSRLIIREIELDIDIPDRNFSQSMLQRRR